MSESKDQADIAQKEVQINLSNNLMEPDVTQSPFSFYFNTKMFDAAQPREWLTKKQASMKPWSEFVKVSKFRQPVTFTQCANRLTRNIAYFQTNYAFVFIILAVYCILTSPFLLFAFAAMMCSFYFIRMKSKNGLVQFYGSEFTTAKMYAIAGLFSVILFLLAGGGSVVFWIIIVSIHVICIHGALYSADEPEDPFDQVNLI